MGQILNSNIIMTIQARALKKRKNAKEKANPKKEQQSGLFVFLQDRNKTGCSAGESLCL